MHYIEQCSFTAPHCERAAACNGDQLVVLVLSTSAVYVGVVSVMCVCMLLYLAVVMYTGQFCVNTEAETEGWSQG